MVIRKMLFAAVTAAAVLTSCKKVEYEPYVPTPVAEGANKSAATISGQWLTTDTKVDLSMAGSVSSTVVGYMYNSTSTAYPDFFEHSPGIKWGDQYGLYRLRYSSKDADGDIIYIKSKIENNPWAETYAKENGALPNITVREFSNTNIFAMQLEAGSTSTFTMYKYNKTTNAIATTPTLIMQLGKMSPLFAFDVFPITSSKAYFIWVRASYNSYKPTYDYETGTFTELEDPEAFYDGAGTYKGVIRTSRIYCGVVKFGSNYTTMTLYRYDGTTQVTSAADFTVFGSKTDDTAGCQALGTTFVSGSKTGTALDPGFLSISKTSAILYCKAGENTATTLVDEDGNDLLPRCISSGIIAFPKPTWTAGSAYDFLTSGEGPFEYFEYTGNLDAEGRPIYKKGRTLKCIEDPKLYAGSLCVPSVVDWNNDGVLDLVVGNSEGRLLYFRNAGTNLDPRFDSYSMVQSDGADICFRSGYYEVQGTFESSWGYLCPNCVDWNGDGIPDVVFSSNEGKFEVMIATGRNADGTPVLGPRQSLTCDGLEVYGQWRVRPGVATVGNTTYMVTYDQDKYLRRYRRTSNTTVEDLGRICNIQGGYKTNITLPSGAQGRMKIEYADWDGDGVLDLVLGAPWQMNFGGFPWGKHGSPHTKGSSMMCMWLKNKGTDAVPVYDTVEGFEYKGTDPVLGMHANSPVACMLGTVTDGLPNLLIGTESGKFMFYEHSDITYEQ